jgi:hypothetical protein
LCNLLVKAIEETDENDAARPELSCLLKSTALIPVPDGVKLVDGARRVSLDRLVAKSSPGSDLGGWLLPISEFGKQGRICLPLADRIKEIASIPESPTPLQALAYLEWAWQHEPEAERVRRTLPRAYGLILEAVETEEIRERWDRARHGAKVYGSNRRWESVKSENVFLDDLGEVLLRSREELIFATPGHFGDTSEQQRRVAEMLGVELLSRKFQIEVQVEGSKSPIESWKNCLSRIYHFLAALSGPGADGSGCELPALTFFVCDGLKKVIYSGGQKAHSWDVNAACEDNTAFLSGRPIRFMADLTTLLLRKTGLAERQDLDDLAPTVTQLVASLDSPDEFEQLLRNARQKYRLPPETILEMEENHPKEEEAQRHHVGDEEGQNEQEADGDGQRECSGTTREPSQRQMDTPAENDKDWTTSTHAGQDAGGSYTSLERERRLNAVREKKKKLDQLEQQLLAVAPLPTDNSESEAGSDAEERGEFGTDDQFRDAVLQYERHRGRFPEAAGPRQAGFDIDSFDRPAENPDRLLIRRIEVKGRGRQWTDAETVELSARQFFDAKCKRVEGGKCSDDFDYWLYIVERGDDGNLNVLPIRNPAERTAKFEFRGGTWRPLADNEANATHRESAGSQSSAIMHEE